MEFTLSKAKLREWRHNDAPALAKHANNKKIADNLRDGFPFPYTLEDADQWLKKAIHEPTHILLAIEVDGEAAGGIGILFKEDVYKLNAEIGYWLGEPYWNKGIMTESIKAIADYIFKETEIVRIYADIFSTSTASMRAISKAGFSEECIQKNTIIKNGIVMDQHVYCKLKKSDSVVTQ